MFSTTGAADRKIKGVIGKFQSMIDDLNESISIHGKNVETNTEAIKKLESDSDNSIKQMEVAYNLVAKIGALIN